jgi:hypothetical protein
METMLKRALRAATGGAAHGHQRMRNAERMNGKAKGLSNVTLVSFVTVVNPDRD